MKKTLKLAVLSVFAGLGALYATSCAAPLPVGCLYTDTTKLNSHCFSSALGLMDLIIDTIEQQRQPAAGAGGKIKDFFRSLLGG